MEKEIADKIRRKVRMKNLPERNRDSKKKRRERQRGDKHTHIHGRAMDIKYPTRSSQVFVV